MKTITLNIKNYTKFNYTPYFDKDYNEIEKPTDTSYEDGMRGFSEIRKVLKS